MAAVSEELSVFWHEDGASAGAMSGAVEQRA